MRSILIIVVVAVFMREVFPTPVSILKTDGIQDDEKISAKGLVNFLNNTMHALLPGFLQGVVTNLFGNLATPPTASSRLAFPAGGLFKQPFPYYSFSAFIPLESEVSGHQGEVKN